MGASKADYSDFTIPIDASWEPDLWGRVRRTVEASRSEAQASAADVANVSLSLHAELAMDYFQLRGLDAQKDLLDSTVVAYEKALDLTQNRYKAGLASAVDVAQAETQLRTTRAQAIDVGVNRVGFRTRDRSFDRQAAFAIQFAELAAASFSARHSAGGSVGPARTPAGHCGFRAPHAGIKRANRRCEIRILSARHADRRGRIRKRRIHHVDSRARRASGLSAQLPAKRFSKAGAPRRDRAIAGRLPADRSTTTVKRCSALFRKWKTISPRCAF